MGVVVAGGLLLVLLNAGAVVIIIIKFSLAFLWCVVVSVVAACCVLTCDACVGAPGDLGSYGMVGCAETNWVGGAYGFVGGICTQSDVWTQENKLRLLCVVCAGVWTWSS